MTKFAVSLVSITVTSSVQWLMLLYEYWILHVYCYLFCYTEGRLTNRATLVGHGSVGKVVEHSYFKILKWQFTSHESCRVGKFLPVNWKKPVFSTVKTGLAKIVFASKTNSSQNFFLHFFQLKVCYLHNIYLITCYLFNCWHRVQSFFSKVMLKEFPRLKSTTNSTWYTRPRLHPCRCHLSRPTSDAEPEWDSDEWHSYWDNVTVLSGKFCSVDFAMYNVVI